MTMRIPSEKIVEGIKVSLGKAKQHLLSAEVLVTKNFLNNAAVLIEFAIEEFGRAVALREKLQAGSEDIERALFTNHHLKYEKAWSVLPHELKIIYEGTFSPLDFHPDDFDAGMETISPQTRLDATFVHFDEHTQEWKKGIQIDPEKLLIIIKEIRENVANFKC